MTLYLALLRGINVGGRNRVPMAELKAAMEQDGFENVTTYLQTGNILFDADEEDRPALAEQIKQLIYNQFGTTTPVVIRVAEDLERTLTRNPFLADEEEFKWLHVMFLNGVPQGADIDKLDPDRSPGDRFAVDGQDIYLHFPNGSGRSKLTIDYFERVLGLTATGRNWNTVTRLQAMMGERASPK